MVGHTVVEKIKGFLSGLFKRKSNAFGWQAVPLHVVDGCGADRLDVQDLMDDLALQGKYRKPQPFDGCLCDEEGIGLLEFNARKMQRMEERKKETGFVYSIRSSGGWGYGADNEPCRHNVT